ncbi:hypothetical protein HNY73_004660 [Argiope bruennichi]|uniref:Uncharacterized protein n=1 Tax=Argiope bruennichi TaxID=94029 RepID=A0A8T0FSH6_ARGBR|nr:hypothetical protein HNY73_004660 [Argiope bruennichi]
MFESCGMEECFKYLPGTSRGCGTEGRSINGKENMGLFFLQSGGINGGSILVKEERICLAIVSLKRTILFHRQRRRITIHEGSCSGLTDGRI